MNEALVEILIVEDNPSDLELALHALRRNHIANRIEVARDGAEALEKLFGDGPGNGPTCPRPRVIFLDLKLPKVDGLEVLRRLKDDPETRTIPVVIMTSSREERDLVDSYRLGVNSYVVKPVDFQQFTEAARALGFYWLLLNQVPQIPGSEDETPGRGNA